MSRIKTVGITLLVIVLGGAATYGSIVGVNAYNDQQYVSLHQGCSPHYASHLVTIKDAVVSPENTVASKCDTLTIKNLDDVDRMMAFGVHEMHTPYDGVEERELLGNQEFTITLIQTGSFKFHDHMHDEVAGTFQVQ
ncbi:MAG: hypothetical protein JWO99_265 [Candidatus Saccharibacteria bacterium]|nr:hypothetical protein [Candidatus Saccharibacteria bacterium]